MFLDALYIRELVCDFVLQYLIRLRTDQEIYIFKELFFEYVCTLMEYTVPPWISGTAGLQLTAELLNYSAGSSYIKISLNFQYGNG